MTWDDDRGLRRVYWPFDLRRIEDPFLWLVVWKGALPRSYEVGLQAMAYLERNFNDVSECVATVRKQRVRCHTMIAARPKLLSSSKGRAVRHL